MVAPLASSSRRKRRKSWALRARRSLRRLASGSLGERQRTRKARQAFFCDGSRRPPCGDNGTFDGDLAWHNRRSRPTGFRQPDQSDNVRRKAGDWQTGFKDNQRRVRRRDWLPRTTAQLRAALASPDGRNRLLESLDHDRQGRQGHGHVHRARAVHRVAASGQGHHDRHAGRRGRPNRSW